MNLQPKYFDFIKDGTKRIELRLYDEKRQSIQLGDIIEFAKSDDEKFKAEVVGEFYSEEKQAEFGVIGIRIKLI